MNSHVMDDDPMSASSRSRVRYKIPDFSRTRAIFSTIALIAMSAPAIKRKALDLPPTRQTSTKKQVCRYSLNTAPSPISDRYGIETCRGDL